MAEVGLLPLCSRGAASGHAGFATLRSRFSKHQFTQPQLLAVLCLMRYEDWTFSRSRSNACASTKSCAPHCDCGRCPTTPRCIVFCGGWRMIRRSRIAGNRAPAAAPPEPAHFCRHRRHGALRYFRQHLFHRRLEQHAHGPRPRRPWLKWFDVVDVRQQILLAQRARQGPGCDARALRGCSMWRHKALRSGWCWRMRSLTPKPTTSTFGNAWEPRALIPPDAGVSRTALFAIRCSEPFRKNRIGNVPRSKASSRPSNANSPRAHPDAPSHPGPPSPVARPGLQHLPPEASVCSGRMSTEPKC